MTTPPVITLALAPKTKSDQDQLVLGLQMLMAENPTLSRKTDAATGEVVIGCTGELQLEIIRTTRTASCAWARR